VSRDTDASPTGKSHQLQEDLIGRQAATDEFPKVDDTRGSARAEAYWPAGRLYAGIGLAAVGALLATVWADVPDVSLSLERGGARFSKTFGF